jgi:hypothetical protein
VFPPARVTTSAAARLRHVYRTPPRETSSCRYRYRSRRFQNCGVVTGVAARRWGQQTRKRPHGTPMAPGGAAIGSSFSSWTFRRMKRRIGGLCPIRVNPSHARSSAMGKTTSSICFISSIGRPASCRTYPFWQGTNPRPFQSGPSTPSIQSAVAMASATMRPPPSHIATLSGRGYGAVTSLPVLGGLHHQYCRI